MNINSILRIVAGIVLLTACTAQGTKDPVIEDPIEPAVTVHSDPTEGQVALMSALRETGAHTELGNTIEQPFLAARGHILKVNEAEVQVFEYDSANAMKTDAAQVSADGRSVGTTTLTWMATPHFYKSDRMLFLYVGNDAQMLSLLELVLGQQFAGG